MTNKLTWQFRAELHLLRTEEGGRRSAFRAGRSLYRPQFYIDSPDDTTTCFIDRIEGKEEMSPGESGDIEARLLHPEIFADKLKTGARFKLREGAKPIGWGVVTETR